ncbi:V4R domain-containing protein [Ureibacillus composti]
MNNSISNVDSSDLIITSQGFGLLRKALIENMGKERAKVFLYRFGKVLGNSKVEELKKQYTSTKDLVGLASEVHTKLGHVSAIESNGEIIQLEDGTLKFENVLGKWFDSFEAKLHVEHYGKSSECSCYTLGGFASGYLSTIFNKEIYVKETYCQSMGYAECTFEIKELKDWLNEDPQIVNYLQNQTIYEELELTYDTLLAQKSMLDKIANYHSDLTQCIAHENSLHHVLSTAFNALEIPIVINNSNNKLIATTGITETEYLELTNSSNKKSIVWQQNETIYTKIGDIHELSTPIYLDHKLFATCSFIYLQQDQLDDHDYLFLERLASVAALCFLKEKISIETTERLKLSILDRLINEQYSSIQEITSQLKLLSSNFENPYYALSINCSATKNKELPIDIYDQLLQISQTFKLFSIDSLLSILQNEIVVLIYNGKSKGQLVKDIEKALVYIKKNNPTIQYKIGVSTEFSSLTEISNHLQQAKHAARLPRDQLIIQYEDLGILGHFLSHTNIDNIKRTATNELGDLLKKDSKSKELLYTLYTFLMNGKRLEKTMQDLALSMGGIQYRIRKIEEITNKNLKDFYTASYLLLLIESLITLGEIEWEN